MKVQNRFKALRLSSVLLFMISIVVVFQFSQTLLAGTSIIYGSVTDANELPLRNAIVSLTSTDDSYYSETDTDSDGFYIFEELEAGDYELVAEKDGYQYASAEISLDEDEVYEVETLKLDEEETGSIYGYIYDVKGDPVENVQLKIKGLTAKYNEKTATDRDGFFEFTDLDADIYVITAKKKRYKTTRTTIELEELEDREIEIELRKTTSRGGIYVLLLENGE